MQGLETNNCENPRMKNFINPSCPKHPKIIIWNEKLQIFIFTLFVVPQKDFIFFRLQKGSVKIKNLSSPLLFQIGTTRIRLCCCAILVSLTMEIHENNIGISRVTNKQKKQGSQKKY